MAKFCALTPEDEAALRAVWLHESRERFSGRGAMFVTMEAGTFMRLFREMEEYASLLNPHDEAEIKRAYKNLQQEKGESDGKV